MKSKYRFIVVKKGFTLVELILTLAVVSVISFTVFQSMNKDFEDKQADAAGEQIKNVGMAVNNYIVNHYDVLSKLSNSNGLPEDLGPRVCDSNTKVCEITVETLANEGMLPPSYLNKNVYGAGYKISITRKGSSPYWNISSLITTDKPLFKNGVIRYDLLGKAMQKAGSDSGMTKTLLNRMDGFKGTWNATQTDYPNINNLGLLGYIAGYGSNSYSAFLRRDGTLPMTGDLNLGTKNIYNINNVTASGKGTFGGEVEAGAWVHAKNGYGDVISLGGDSSTNDYEIRLGTDKPLSIHGPAPVQVNVSGSLRAGVDLSADRNISAGNWLSAKNGLGNKVMIGGDSTGDYDIVFEPSSNNNNVVGFFSTNSSIPFDFSFRGNVNALNALGNKMGASMNGATGDISASGNITSNKNVAGQYFMPNAIATVGETCYNNGLISRDAEGAALSCINGVFAKQKFKFTTYDVLFPARTSSGRGDEWQTKNLGVHLFCFLSGIQTASDPSSPDAKHVVVLPGAASGSGYTWTLAQRVTIWPAGWDTWAYATCAD